MKKTMWLIAVLCGQLGGKSMAQAPAGFTITGSMDQSTEASKVYLLYQYDGQKFVDSAAVLNRQFQIKGTVENVLFATLLIDRKGVGLKRLLKTPLDEIDVLKFYLLPGNTGLKLKDSISTAVFINSRVNQDYARLKIMLGTNAENKLYHLSVQRRKLRTLKAEKAYKIYYDSLKAARRLLLKKFVQENPASYISLLALIDYAGAVPDTAEISPLFRKMDVGLRNNRTGMKFKMLLDSRVAVGNMAPDFTQNDVQGRPVKLSSFRGKFVLIDFWASWCVPCRFENPEWVKAFAQLKGKKFTMLGISLDGQETRAAWLKAIKDDGLTWPQVSDLKRFDNAVSKRYGIKAIPQNVLIDTNGKVIAKNIEPGEVVSIIERRNYKNEKHSVFDDEPIKL